MKKKTPKLKRTNPVAKHAHTQNRAQCLEPHKSYKRRAKHRNNPEGIE